MFWYFLMDVLALVSGWGMAQHRCRYLSSEPSSLRYAL